MELKRLKYFVTAAHELSFSGAARKLGVSQPVLSRGIKELEAYVGAELFNRSTKEVSLTPAGDVLLPKADEALLILDETILSVRQVVQGRESLLDIAYLPVQLEAFVAPAMEMASQTASSLVIRLHEMTTAAQLDALRSGVIDIACICYYEEDDFGSEFDLFDICEAGNCAVVSSSNPLAQAESLSLEEIAHLDLVTFPSSQYPHCARALENYFKKQNIPYNPVMEANSLHSMISSAIPGSAFVIMTELATTIAPRAVSFVPLRSSEDYRIKFGALVKRDERRKSVLAFLQECRRVAETRIPQIQEENLKMRLAANTSARQGS